MGMLRLYFVSLLLLGLSSCQQGTAEQAEKLTFQEVNYSLQDTSLSYRITATYPQIDSASVSWQEELNAYFEQQLLQDADSFRAFIQDFEPDMLRELEGIWQLHSNKPGFFSISQRFIWAVPGTSVLLGEVKTTNYLTAEKKHLSLADCFREADFSQKLVNQVNAEVEKSYGIGICGKAEATDLAAFAIEKAGLRFFLDVYQGNHACQQVEIVLPFEKLKDDIKAFIPQLFE